MIWGLFCKSGQIRVRSHINKVNFFWERILTQIITPWNQRSPIFNTRFTAFDKVFLTQFFLERLGKIGLFLHFRIIFCVILTLLLLFKLTLEFWSDIIHVIRLVYSKSSNLTNWIWLEVLVFQFYLERLLRDVSWMLWSVMDWLKRLIFLVLILRFYHFVFSWVNFLLVWLDKISCDLSLSFSWISHFFNCKLRSLNLLIAISSWLPQK